ncbi:transcriptional regulator, TetR family [Saccharopolyspora kobensis]|uniref:Transcriptional regulator, TetR family n=2 Tax=Saccharopolyspora kobensis TaxID=146035 RepID=A0A1H6EJT3_9PSEU|nr:TetR/AcrR family transcriptional regulator [Saccharopolyspora kobensis]SEG97129.1 transcriptional regulator, TetR family [Saccharopolyspora kobensis]SFE66831.1 transcriptional regulator, TetR family [Saccharopolyspora kobensis]
MQTQQASTGRRKRMSRAEREQQILAVAEEVFAADGYQATSMDDIAARVGLSKPMLYEYFGSKEGLLLACLKRCKRELIEASTVAAAGADTPEQLMHDCLLAFFRFGDEHAQAWALLRNEAAVPSASVSSELEAIRLQQRDFTSGLLKAARPDLDDEQLEAFAEAIIGACERLALWREQRPEVTPEKATEHLMTLFAPSLTQNLR